jgi:hypothetical protein
MHDQCNGTLVRINVPAEHAPHLAAYLNTRADRMTEAAKKDPREAPWMEDAALFLRGRARELPTLRCVPEDELSRGLRAALTDDCGQAAAERDWPMVRAIAFLAEQFDAMDLERLCEETPDDFDTRIVVTDDGPRSTIVPARRVRGGVAHV